MHYPFSDLVAILDIQRMLDTFESGSGISTQIMDMDGEIIVASPSRNMWHEFHPDSIRFRQNAGEASFHVNAKSTQRDEPISGLFQYARAIQVEDREVGTLFLGPLIHAQPDQETFRELAQRFGFEETANFEKVKSVPIVTEEQAQHYVEFLVQLIESLAKKGLDEKRLIASLTASQEQVAKLQRAYDELAARIL
ncbi:MAG TPA: PocR ligand-binding domain-containing protein, partial [Anaerolineales bacterium]|nr:PocR ligand-binding domain-containing protein [Anaerolineales bacterium]